MVAHRGYGSAARTGGSEASGGTFRLQPLDGAAPPRLHSPAAAFSGALPPVPPLRQRCLRKPFFSTLKKSDLAQNQPNFRRSFMLFQPLTVARPPSSLSIKRPALTKLVAVGMPVTRNPPHRSQRALLTHWASAAGDDAQTAGSPLVVPGRAHIAGLSGPVPGPWFAQPGSPWPASFSPPPPQAAAHHSPCSGVSPIL
jgi:hypothetical protein